MRVGSFFIESLSAGLTNRNLVLQEAQASTCACESGGLYSLRAPNVVFDIQRGDVVVREGSLEVLGVRVALNRNSA